jgi:hypothetical protein
MKKQRLLLARFSVLIANEGNLIFMTWVDDVEWGSVHIEMERVE